MSFADDTMDFHHPTNEYATDEHARDQASTTPLYPRQAQEETTPPAPHNRPQPHVAPQAHRTHPQNFMVQSQVAPPQVHQTPRQNITVQSQVAPQVHQSHPQPIKMQPQAPSQVHHIPQQNIGLQPQITPQINPIFPQNLGVQTHPASQVFQNPQHNFAQPQIYQTHPQNLGSQPQMQQNYPQTQQNHPQALGSHQTHPQVYVVQQNHPQVAVGAQQPHQNQSHALGIPTQMGGGLWSTGLFDCFVDVPQTCITTWLPCITFGQTSEIIDRGASSCGVNGALYGLIMGFTGLHCIYAWLYRTKLKQQYGMPQDSFEDFCIHFWCHGCALCQEYRELQNRGFDVPLGWYGNVERMNRASGVTNPPVVQGGMTR